MQLLHYSMGTWLQANEAKNQNRKKTSEPTNVPPLQPLEGHQEPLGAHDESPVEIHDLDFTMDDVMVSFLVNLEVIIKY